MEIIAYYIIPIIIGGIGGECFGRLMRKRREKKEAEKNMHKTISFHEDASKL